MLGFSGTRKWVYPLDVKGRFQRLHRQAGILQHLILFGLPWLTIAGNPALKIDLPARRVYALGGVFSASDTFLLLMILLFAAFSLFFFTSLYGRLWCGYLCPQTVFLEEWIRPIERWIEGDRGVRKARDRGPWTVDRAWRKAAKWSLFAVVATVLSTGFMAYFAGKEIWYGGGGAVEYALVAIFATGWFFDFAWYREQMCNFICPYARFQGALTDDESLVVAYDERRGEPRGKEAKARGGCIDCGKCVAVCPQGIDIRDGYQLECVNCARCIDACAGVMGKLGHPNLISYTTVAATEGRATRWIRPRTVVYAGLLSAITAAFLIVLADHEPLEVAVSRAPGTLYQVDADGWIRNTYLLRVKNNDPQSGSRSLHVEVEGLPGAEVATPDFTLEPLESRILPLVVRIPPSDGLGRTLQIELEVSAGDTEIELTTNFKTPGGES